MKDKQTLTHKLIFVVILCLTTLICKQAIAAQACIQVPDGLAAWWQAEGNGNDAVGQNDGTLIGGVSFASGRAGQGIHFDGVSGEVRVNHTSDLNFGPTDSISIEAWVKPDQFMSTPMVIVMLTYACTSEYIATSVGSDGRVNFGFRDNVGLYVNTYSTGSIRDGQWHHIVGVRDVATHTGNLYIDGALIDTQQDPTTGTFTITNPADGIGAEPVPCPNKYYWKGDMDEVKIYRRALSSSEVQASYLVGSVGKWISLDRRAPQKCVGCP